MVFENASYSKISTATPGFLIFLCISAFRSLGFVLVELIGVLHYRYNK